ncbi:MAG: hypothetical protein IH945_04675 [Armatimonadetes bacterium]|nr:hypothetical protein [Armatimonadota bacterium]
MIVGNVLLIALIVITSAATGWAGAVLSAILFPERTERASMHFENRAWKTFFLGLLMFVPIVFIGVALTGAGYQVISIPLFAAVIGISIFGTGGLVRLVARRVHDHGGSTSSYQAIAKGGLLVVLAELLPIFGWVVIFPYVLIASFGAGVFVLFGRRKVATVETGAPPTAEAS